MILLTVVSLVARSSQTPITRAGRDDGQQRVTPCQTILEKIAALSLTLSRLLLSRRCASESRIFVLLFSLMFISTRRTLRARDTHFRSSHGR